MITVKKSELSIYNDSLKIILKDEIEFKDECIYVLFGQNGIGKSSFGKILAGIEKTKTQIFKAKRFLFHPQEAFFVPGSALDNTCFYLPSAKKKLFPFKSFLEDKGCSKDTADLISNLLSEISTKEISELSGGQKQLLLFFRTLLIFLFRENEFSGIIFDEPAKELSSDRIKIMIKVFGELNIHCPIMYISHDFNFIYSLISVFINRKDIVFLEFSENEVKDAVDDTKSAEIAVNVIGALKKHDLYSDWINITRVSGYLRNLFGMKEVDDVNRNEATIESVLNGNYKVVKSSPTFHGLFETILKSETENDKYFRLLTVSLPNRGESIPRNIILCALE